MDINSILFSMHIRVHSRWQLSADRARFLMLLFYIFKYRVKKFE